MLTQILFQILQRTPVWVYGLFFGLLALGYLQSKPRELSKLRLAVLPLVLCALSLAQVWAGFSAQPLAYAAWSGGIAVALLANRALKQPAGARWSAASGTFHVPGSWTPLALMMAIFFARYALNVSLAFAPGLAQLSGFAAAASFGFGLLSGTFLARALWVWSLRPARTAHARAYDQA
ncbi:MAG: tat pathway signal sequence [Burkholderiales bacterium]|nr:tat pathway signal sequence [Burkholderiales bacterium]